MLDIILKKILIEIIWDIEFSCTFAVCPVEQFKDSSSQVHDSDIVSSATNPDDFLPPICEAQLTVGAGLLETPIY